MPEQHLGGLVGVTHAAVPVEPEDADGAVIQTKLRQTLRFFGRLAQLDIAPGGLQPAFQQAMLMALPGQHQQAGQQQHAEQKTETAPVADLATEVDAAGLEPLFLQLTEFPRRKLPYRRLEHGGKFRAVTPRGDTQKLRVAQITHHRQRVVLHLLRKAAEHRLVNDGIACLGFQYLAQRIALAGRGQHGDIGIVAGEELGDRPRPDGGDQLARVQIFKIDCTRAATITDEQARDTQKGIAISPQPQACRRLP